MTTLEIIACLYCGGITLAALGVFAYDLYQEHRHFKAPKVQALSP